MPMIPEDEIERIKQTTDLAAVIRARGVDLKPQGHDLVGLCPFHEDHDPSLRVTPAKGLWRCMSCGATGNVIQFVQRFDGVSFRHAFELLKGGAAFTGAPAGQPVKKTTVPRLPAPVAVDADDQAALRQVLDYYHERLRTNENPAALAYLQKRGIAAEAIDVFRLGFVDRTLGLRLPQKNRKEGAELRERLTRLGILRDTGHEHLRGRIVFPVIAENGEIGTVYGRAIDDGGKHDRHLFLPGPQRGIWNPAALRSSEVIVTEGIIDALSFWGSGYRNVTTGYSAKALPDELLDGLLAAKVQRVLLAFDRDEAGDKGSAEAAAQLAAHGIEVLRVMFPPGFDANRYALEVTPAEKSLGLLLRTALPMGEGGKVSSRVPAPSSSSIAAKAAPEAAPVAPMPEAGPTPTAEAAKEKMPVPVIAAVPAVSVVAVMKNEPEEIELGVGDRVYRVRGLAKNSGFESLRVSLRVLWYVMKSPTDPTSCKVLVSRRGDRARRNVDTAGIGTVAPVMILSRRWGPPRLPTLRGVIRALLQVLGPALLLANAFGPVHPGGSLLALMLPLPLAAVLVVSFGLAAAVEAVLLMDLTLVALTARGLGFFGGQDDWSALLGLGSHMTLLTAMTLTLGGIKRQRQRAERVAAAAMQEAGVALWIWISGRGLILHDPEWAACFGVAAGVPATPEQIDAATHPEDRLSLRLWCASDEAPPAAGVEEFRMKGSDGCWHWVTSRRLHAIPGFPPAEGTLYGVFQDLTEHKEMERVRLEATRQEAELRNLKLSIQPHFLFNSLNSLRSLIASRPAEAREFVTRLAAFLHTAVADAGEDLLPLARSLAVVETYLAIERTRFGDRLRVSEAIAPEARGAAFPPLILQTLVENALKYGVAKRPEGGEIRIEATVSEGWLRVAVVNDGCIVPAPAHALGTGLKSAERRVKLLFGEAASVRLREDATPRVTAEVVVPLRLVASPAASPTFP